MKVNIGPYKDYYSIYYFTDKLKYVGVSEDASGVIGDYIDKTFVGKFIRKFNDWNKRKIKVRIDNYDTWGMYNTLSVIIAPMLRQLKATKHGWPIVDDEDVPDELKTYDLKYEDDEGDTKFPAKWEYVLDEMIFTFETFERATLYDEDWSEKYYSGEYDLRCEEVVIDGETLYEMVQGPNHTMKCDMEGFKKEQARINNGCRLFGKYYQNLWD